MSRKRFPRDGACPRVDGGFALVAAIFVLLTLAALAAFAFRIGLNQQQTASYDLLVVRAQAAADSGIEYAANQALKSGSCLSSTPLTLTAVGLSGFTVTVTCQRSPVLHRIGAQSYPAFTLTSTARRGTYGSADFVSRTAAASVSTAP
jgi:MSHA biogenesis protein MshP